MFVVGLTGGIGSGKSTVATLFAAKNIPIIDTDEIARKVTEPNEPALKEISNLFGPNVLSPTGQLDRAKLRMLIFSNDTKRKQLEQLLHPLIRAEMSTRIQKLDTPYCIAVIPLLLETTPNPLINRILVVDTIEDLQISRGAARDQLARSDIEAIIKTQVTRSKRLELADDVIINNGSHEDLIPQIDKLHALYLTLAKTTFVQK